MRRTGTATTDPLYRHWPPRRTCRTFSGASTTGSTRSDADARYEPPCSIRWRPRRGAPSYGSLTRQAGRKYPHSRCRTSQLAMPGKRGWPSREPCPATETSRGGLPVSCKGANQRGTGPAPEERRRTSVPLGGFSERWLDSSGGRRSGGKGARRSDPDGRARQAVSAVRYRPVRSRSGRYCRCTVLPLGGPCRPPVLYS